MVTKKRFTRLRCPGNKKHIKRRGDYLVTEKCCNTLLGFIDTSVDGTEVSFKCRDCKGVINVKVEDSVAYMKVLPSDTVIKLDDGKVVVNVS